MSGPVYTGVFELSGAEALGWVLQLGLIAWLLLRRPGASPLPSLPIAACVLIVAAGWIWRLAYGFTLAADDFGYWIGDDPYRFAHAWEWSRDPVLTFPRDPWIAGSYYLHGSAMWLLGGDPLHASKFVSAFYGVMPLIGVFLFAQALFARREIAALAVVLVTPAWIQVLLETGLMTELPVTGLLLSGTACLLWGLDAPVGPRRNRLHVAGAILLATATAFHLVAWIHLAVIQAGLLLARALGRRPARLGEWALVTAGSGLFCAFWLGVQWHTTGNPLAQLAFAGADDTPFKLSGTPLQNAAIYPVGLGFSLRSLLPLVAFGVLAPFVRGTAPPRARWVMLGLGVSLLVMVVSAVSGGTNVTPFRSVAPLAAAFAAYAAAGVFPARTPPAGSAGRLWPRPALAVLALAVALEFADGHARIFEHRIAGRVTWNQREPRAIPANLFALGRWLRREIPRRASDSGEILPARVPIVVMNPIGWSLLLYGVGEPAWIERAPMGRLAEGLRPGQLVVSQHEIRRHGLRPLLSIGPYTVYELPRQERAPGSDRS